LGSSRQKETTSHASWSLSISYSTTKATGFFSLSPSDGERDGVRGHVRRLLTLCIVIAQTDYYLPGANLFHLTSNGKHAERAGKRVSAFQSSTKLSRKIHMRKTLPLPIRWGEGRGGGSPSVLLRQLPLVASILGLALFPARSQTNPPFSIQQRIESSWLVNPNGQKFFSLGVCVVNQGHSSTTFNPTNPGYAAFQHYADSNRWAKATVQRLKKW